MHIAYFIGTRPEAIKVAPVIMHGYGQAKIKQTVVLTGQHQHMARQVLGFFEIAPSHDLAVMTENQSLDALTCKIISSSTKVLRDIAPDVVLVHGDTTTTFGVALSAFYKKIPVGHIEAGLRTGDKFSPWPEEANRCMVASLATHHFAPTQWARDNLVKEGISSSKIAVTGNTVIDALLLARARINENPRLLSQLSSAFPFADSSRFILVTLHRRENFGEGFRNACAALRELAVRFPTIKIIFPVHLNPNVRQPVFQHLSDLDNVHLIDPLDYPAFVYLMARCELIITDSGGIQEEGPSFKKPVLVMRDTTERPEAVQSGTVELVGTDLKRIVGRAVKILSDVKEKEKFAAALNPFGDGSASEKIFTYLRDTF